MKAAPTTSSAIWKRIFRPPAPSWSWPATVTGWWAPAPRSRCSTRPPEVRRPFEQSPEFDPAQVLYLGESVLLPDYRGQGLGHAFFDQREAHARTLGLPVTAFCAVQRSPSHPARPAGHRPLNAFWQARGYAERPDLQTEMSWQELGEVQETPKPMRFWVRQSP